jgi:hypothetical protein
LQVSIKVSQKNRGQSLTAADAEGMDGVSSALLLHLIDGEHGDARPTRAVGVAEGNGPAYWPLYPGFRFSRKARMAGSMAVPTSVRFRVMLFALFSVRFSVGPLEGH